MDEAKTHEHDLLSDAQKLANTHKAMQGIKGKLQADFKTLAQEYKDQMAELRKHVVAFKTMHSKEIEELQAEHQSGIENIETLRTDINRSIPGLSFCVYNPIYNGKDKKVFDTRCKLKPYQIPYIESPTAFKDKIVIKSLVTNKRVVEY